MGISAKAKTKSIFYDLNQSYDDNYLDIIKP